ncbi:MAG: hypothetical protein V1727_05545 [Candidatus Omnitrophota bacterium]
MIASIFKTIVGILLLPVSLAATKAFAVELGQIKQLDGSAEYFLNGVLIYLVIHLVLHKPDFFYVFGHEVAHALAALLCGGRVNSFNVSARGGAVTTSKSNSFIALFPYFFPTYTILVWLAYFFTTLFYHKGNFMPHFLFLVGFTLALHLIMTADSLKIKQPDIFKTGYLFSISMVYVLNLLLISFILSLVFAGFSFSQFFLSGAERSGEIYQAIYSQLFL